MTAGLFLAIDLVLWNHAISDVGAGVATVIGNLQVLFVAVFAWLVLRWSGAWPSLSRHAAHGARRGCASRAPGCWAVMRRACTRWPASASVWLPQPHTRCFLLDPSHHLRDRRRAWLASCADATVGATAGRRRCSG